MPMLRGWLADGDRDIRYAIRTLRRSPGFTLVAVLTLALGIGANTAMFSIVNSLLLRTLPVDRPDRLVLLLSNPTVTPASPFSNPVWEQIRDRHGDLFQTSFAFSRRTTRFNLAAGGPTEFVDGIFASGRYFEALGVRPVLGRTFTSDDDRRGGGADGAVAVISDRLWQRRFHGGFDVIGRTQTLDRVPFTIVGVMPAAFFGTDVGTQSDIIVPIGTEPLLRGRDSALDRTTTSSLLIMARLKDNQTIASAEQALRGVQPRIRDATMPANARPEARARYLTTPFGVQPAAGGTSAMRGRYSQPLLAIMAIVGLVLLIAAANIANLFLARATARVHELSVRQALGASRWRLARQQLVEGLIVSVAGGVAGLMIARWVSDLLVGQFSTYASTVFLDTHLDWRVLAFTASVAVAVALLFGVAPAVRASNANPVDAMREHGRAGAGARSSGVAGALVVGQIALSLVLVVAAGLFIRTFTTLATRDLGFDREAVLLVRLDVPADRDTPTRVHYEQIATMVRGVSGVAHAAISEITPVSGMITDHYIEIDGGPPLQPPRNIVYRNVITPDWFATYGTRMVAGRDFDGRDQLTAAPVAIVNETFVRRFLPGGSAVGSRIRNPSSVPGQTPPWMEVIGVVGDAAYLTVREVVPPTMYVPLGQQDVTRSFTFVTLSVRTTTGSPEQLARSVDAAFARVDPAIAITFVPLRQQVDAALVQERIVALVAGSFAVLAMLLSAVGLYGVTVYSVNRRRTEIGIRIAIGAAPARVVRLVLGRVILLLSLGVLIGAGASMWASKFVAALLYGLEPRDSMTLVSAAAVLATVGAVAGWLPAYRASRMNPIDVLRE